VLFQGEDGLIQAAEFEDLRDSLARLATDAAATILEHYRGDVALNRQTKADDTPVTAADYAAHDILVTGLSGSGLPVLSEEEIVDSSERLQWNAFWMVDPLDGTREFLEGTGEFSVNIALIERQVATLGLIAIPVTGEIFAGGPGLGAWRRQSAGWEAVHSRQLSVDVPLRVLTSRRHRGPALEDCLANLASGAIEIERGYSGSAIKFCRIADGSADFYPRFSPCSEWDTAAGQALVEGSGGAVLGLDGSPLRYNSRDSLISPNFLAMGDPAHAIWENLR
jgi:3'(2'), 5'-bisphosphate nucleotidase